MLTVDRDGLTPLHFAIRQFNVTMSKQILSICPETVNSFDKRGVTPFVQAILIGADEVSCSMLIDRSMVNLEVFN